MEIMITWFWMIKLIVTTVCVYSIIKLYKSNYENRFWWFMSILGFILVAINPIKMQNISTNYNNQQNHHIEQHIEKNLK